MPFPNVIARCRINRPKMTSISAACLLALFALSSGAHGQQPVNRCEDGTGRITYSNESCPSGTKVAKVIPYKPAVQVHDGKAATNGENEKDAKEGATDDGKVHNARTSGELQRGAAPNRAFTPDQAREAASDRRRQHIALCDDLVRKVDYAQQDVAAAGADRSSAELALRRVQAQYKEQCGKR